MCTALSFTGKHHYFGRNLDLEYGYDECVAVTPRRYPLPLRHLPVLESHHALIGMAFVPDAFPLYYEASNDCGLSMAGLHFPGSAVYQPFRPDRENVAPFELIPYVLGRCETLAQARKLLERVNLLREDYAPRLPAAPLHWLIADRTGAVTVEPTTQGLALYDNPAGVLTNNPPFPFHMTLLTHYMHLTVQDHGNLLFPGLPLTPGSRGMSAMGLPGDLSSPSRFVRCCFSKLHALPGDTPEESLSQVFHILDSVAQVKGCLPTEDGRQQYTRYSCCCDCDQGVYYYTTYENRSLTAVSLREPHAPDTELRRYPLLTGQHIVRRN